VCAAAVEFGFEDDAQGWYAGVDASRGMANFSASGGKIGFDYVTPSGAFDPMIISPAISVSALREHWLVLELDLTAAPGAGAQSFQIFYVNPSGSFNEPQSRSFSVAPNLGPQTVVFDMTPVQPTRTTWEGTIVKVRIDPGGNANATELAGYRCEFDRIAITDDTDRDGINDDLERFWFGDLDTADAISDYDGDGVRDAVEIALGLNPLTNDAEDLPAAIPLGLTILALCLALAGARVAPHAVAAIAQRR